MKKYLLTLLILLFVLPGLGQWVPHFALESIHRQQELHHQNAIDHNSHSHELPDVSSYSLHFDAITYFDDFLHVDLKNTDQSNYKIALPDVQNIDYTINIALVLQPLHQSTTRLSTGPPIYSWHASEASFPIYLATKRLRI